MISNTSSGVRAQIWALDSNLTFNEVKALQKDTYFEVIKYLSKGNFKKEEKQLYHKWDDIGEVHSYKKSDNSSIRYFTATAKMEKAVSEQSAFADDKRNLLLARERRVYPNDAGTIFLELDGRIYCVIYGSKSAFDVRNILMGGGFGERRKEAWGKIDLKPIQYNLGSDFFYWLFDKQKAAKAIKTVYGDIEIRDIEGIGRYSDRQQHNTKGKGPKSTQELSNKTALGINQSVYESDFNIVTDTLDAYINLGDQSIIDTKRSIFTKTSIVSGVSADLVDFFLQLYTEVIPGLLQQYHSEKSGKIWTTTNASHAQKNWALEVVEELSRHHSITKTELIGMAWFKNQP